MQLDQGEKGFSFSKDGPLDMRMNPKTELTASAIVNYWSEDQLGEIFREYGEEPRWRRAARAIVMRRKKRRIETTGDLAGVIQGELKSRTRGTLNPATLIFQALRMCVNQELESMTEGVSKAIKMLSPGGRIGVISFHRLEDKIVKNIFREGAAIPKKMRGQILPALKLMTKKPIVPSPTEMRQNPRSRSAKMRFAEKVGGEVL